MRRFPSWVLPLSMSLAIAGAVAGGPATQPATQPATKPVAAPVVSKELQTAMDQLAADESADRLAAQDQIVQIGKEAIEPLKALIKSTRDVEQRTGAQAAMARILEQSATGPTYITMKMENASATEIINELSKQSGIAIKNYSMADRAQGANARFSIHIDRQPFWEAARSICKTTGMNIITNRGRGGEIGIGNNGSDGGGPCVVDGAFMIVAQSINMNSNVQLHQPGNISRSQSIQFYCYTEPKLQITQHPYTVNLTEATDDTGKSLVIPQDPNNFEGFNQDNQFVWNSSSQLVVHEPGAKKIVSLKGTVRLQAAIKTRVIEINDILNAKNVTDSAGGITITFKDATVSGDQVDVNLTLLVPPNSENIGYQLAQKIKLLDSSGVALQNEGINGGGSMTKLEYKINFSKRFYDEGEKKAGNPTKLQIPIVLETKPVEYHFEFKDLPLP